MRGSNAQSASTRTAQSPNTNQQGRGCPTRRKKTTMTNKANWNLNTHPGFVKRRSVNAVADLVLIQDADCYPCADADTYGWCVVYDGSKSGGRQHAGLTFIDKDDALANFKEACKDSLHEIWTHLAIACMENHFGKGGS